MRLSSMRYKNYTWPHNPEVYRVERRRRLAVHPVRNDFFGGNVSVTGLVTATDIVAQCKGKLKSRHLGIPEVMLRDEKDRFLDDWTIPRLEKALGIKVHLLPCGGGALVRALLGFRLP